MLSLYWVVILVAIATAKSWGHSDPEIFMKTDEMIRFWGYNAEEHFVTTSDGYILCLHRHV